MRQRLVDYPPPLVTCCTGQAALQSVALLTVRQCSQTSGGVASEQRGNHLQPESQGQTLAVTVLHVPYSLDSGHSRIMVHVLSGGACGRTKNKLIFGGQARFVMEQLAHVEPTAWEGIPRALVKPYSLYTKP